METEVCSNEEETDRKRTLEESFNEFMSKSKVGVLRASHKIFLSLRVKFE
jgi:hypothetical protein